MSNTARRTSVTYPNGRQLNLGYGSSDSIDDLFSLVNSTAISGESGNKVEYSRTGLGRFTNITYPQPGVEMSMIRPGGGSEGDSGDPYDGYDRFGRVQEMRWQSSSTGTPIDAWQWGYNEASNRTWKKSLVAASGQDEAYGYDGLYQVIRDAVGTLNTNRTAIGGVPGEDEDFTYDPTGNWLGYRKGEDGSVVLDQSRSNNKDNQLTQIDGSSALLSYDRAGNATKTTPGTNGDWTKYYQPVWDAWNRIVEVKDENGTTVQKNAYDGLSRRITKEAASVVTHTYWSDRWKPLEERTGSATTAARSYLWGERPGHRDELILRDSDTDGNGSLDERLYATMDYFNGTAVLNTSGVVQERYAYTAFGVRKIMAADFTPRTTSSYAWEFGFQGQFRDNETGWSNYGYRFYVPELGRWINRDPIWVRGEWNLYAFVGNNGVNYYDYLGNSPKKKERFEPTNVDRTANEAGHEGQRRAKEWEKQQTRKDKKSWPREYAGMEFCGRVCCKGGEEKKYTIHQGSSPEEIRTWNEDHPDLKAGGGCSADSSPTCEDEFGPEWVAVATWHTHPSNTPFSPGDKDNANRRNLPNYLTTPDGETMRWDPSPEPYRTDGENDTSGNLAGPFSF